MTLNQSSGTLYIISAPSGAGKTSLLKRLLQQFDNISLSISHTTRPPRPAEKDGLDYFFVAKEKFLEMVEKDQFIEHAKVFDNYYGTSIAYIQENLDKGLDVILEIDWQGAEQVKQSYPDCESIFILPPSSEALYQRLKSRGQDSEEVIDKRMKQAESEISHFQQYEYIVVNDDFDTAVKELSSIIIANRMKLTKQKLRLDNLLEKLLA